MTTIVSVPIEQLLFWYLSLPNYDELIYDQLKYHMSPPPITSFNVNKLSYNGRVKNYMITGEITFTLPL